MKAVFKSLLCIVFSMSSTVHPMLNIASHGVGVYSTHSNISSVFYTSPATVNSYYNDIIHDQLVQIATNNGTQPTNELILAKFESAYRQLKNMNALLGLPVKGPRSVGLSVAVAHTCFEQELQARAAEYGSKTANLMMLDRYIAGSKQLQAVLAQYGITTKIPEFAGLSDSGAQEFLKQNGLDIASEWQRIIDKHVNDAIKREYQESGKIPTGFVDDCQALGLTVQEKFNKAADDFDKQQQTSSASFVNSAVSMVSKFIFGPQTFFDKQTSKLLADGKKYDWRFMERSTGREDTKELANAGGNDSEINILPSESALLRGMGKVISSYLKRKSLTQRVLTKDPTLFDCPLLASLTQRMIGEVKNGAVNATQIPVGCVVYTQEPEGKTDDVILAQCAHGHPAGVVDSIVTTDSYYLTEDTQYPSLRFKLQRLVPTEKDGKTSLDLKNNDNEIQKKPVLDMFAAKAIRHVSAAIHALYNQPMDIELAYEPSTKTIWLVQARPIVYAKETEQPSDVTSLQEIPQQEIIQGTTVLAAGGAARKITQSEQMIIADTLDDALHEYLKPEQTPQRRKNIIGIVVKGNAEATSHAAAVFRGDGKIVMHIDDLEYVKNALKQQPIDLLVLPQRGMIVDVKSNKLIAGKSIETLKQQGLLHDGWINHPAPLEVSVGHTMASICPALPVGLGDFYPECSVDQLIEKIKTEKTEEAKRATFTVLRRIANAIDDKKKEITCGVPPCAHSLPAQKALEQLETIFEHAVYVSKDIFSKVSLAPNDIRRLLPVRFLHALLVQKPSERVINSYSLVTIESDYKQQIAFIDNVLQPLVKSNQISTKLLHNVDLFMIAHKGSQQSFTHETQAAWITFVDQLDDYLSAAEKAQFTQMVDTIDKLSLTAVWINDLFINEWTAVSSAGSVANTLLYQYEQAQKTLEVLSGKQNQLTAFDMKLWQNPEKFNQQQEIIKHLMTYFTSDEFCNLLNPQIPQSSQLVRYAAHSLKYSFIDLVDKSIKEVKGSTQYEDFDRINRVSELVDGYFNLYIKWLDLVPMDKMRYHVAWPRQAYINHLKSVLDLLDYHDQNILLPSNGFNVAAAVLGSATALERHSPRTLEDLFTLTHQNLLFASSVLAQDAGFDRLQIPVIINTLEQKFADFNMRPGDMQKISRVGMSILHNQVVLTYNLPMRNHSTVIEITYDIITQQTILSLKFFGQRPARWNNIKDYAHLVQIIENLEQTNVQSATEQGVTINYLVENTQSLERLPDALMSMYEMAFESERINTIIERHAITQDQLGSYLQSLGDNFSRFSLELADNFLQRSDVQKLSDNAVRGIAKQAYSAVLHPRFQIQILGCRIFDRLVKTGDQTTFDYIVAAASQISEQTHWSTRSSLFHNIYYLAVDENYQPAYDQAVAMTRDEYIMETWKLKVIDLLKNLIHKDHQPALVRAFNLVSEAIEGTIFNNDFLIDKSSELELFKILLQKKYQPAVELMIAETSKLGVEQGYTVCVRAFDLLTSLVGNNYQPVYEQATTAAIQGILEPYGSISFKAVDLLRALFEKNYQPAFEQAATVATQGVLNQNSHIRVVALSLFRALFEKNYQPAFDKATTLVAHAAHGAFSMNMDLRSGVLSLVDIYHAAGGSRADFTNAVAEKVTWSSLAGPR